MAEASRAILRIFDGTNEVDLLGPGSGWRLSDPSWSPQIAQPKGGGHFVDAALAEGRRLVYRRPGNVVETIPLTAYGKDQNRAVQTIRRLLQMLRQGADYWTEDYEYDDIWLEARPGCNDCLTGYTRIVQGQVPELGPPFGQPFFTDRWPLATMEDMNLILEREPFWRALPPGEIIGPLYNLLRNPDFELWNFGLVDSQPDNWDDIETLWITGTNNRQDTAVHSGEHALRVEVRSSTLAGAFKGVTQIAEGTTDNTEYTAIAWVRSDGVSNGVGRILVTYSSQFELYRSSSRHGWTVYAQTFTTGTDDVVAMHCEILTTAANTDGTVYFDSLMIVPGDWTTEAQNGTLPYMSSSHVVNHWDQAGGQIDAGDINWVDVWDVPGDVDALVRLEFQNNQEDLVYFRGYETVRIGQRRTRNVLDFDNFHDPVGPVQTDCSSTDRINSGSLTADWAEVTTKILTGAGVVEDNMGRFRVLARAYDPVSTGDASLQLRLRHFPGMPGVVDKILDGVPLLAARTWNMVDLTPRAAMIFDYKFAADTPRQLGYSVEMRRSSGTDVGWLDYVLVMPTDGGYAEATIDPPLTYQNILVMDGTASSFTVNSTVPFAPFSIVESLYGRVVSLKKYKGKIHIGTYLGAIYRVDPSGTTLLAQLWPPGRGFLEVYNNLLYLWTGRRFYSSLDGEGWTLIQDFVNPAPVQSAIKSFAGKLYFSDDERLQEWDGATVTHVHTFPDDILCIESHRNYLYVGTDAGWIYEWDPISKNTVQSWQPYAFGGVQAQTLTVHRDRLYTAIVGFADLAERIFSYDGSSWTLRFHDPTTNHLNTTLYSFGDYLFRGDVRFGTFTCHFSYSTDEAESFDEILTITDVGATGQPAFGDCNGIVYMAWTTDVWGVVPESATQYSSVSFEGSGGSGEGFKAPPERRHRWVFNWDEYGGINEVDDTALIGVGFVPRYYSLRGAD